ncbi:MAG: hypothetical protein WCJ17_03365 [bacterium]
MRRYVIVLAVSVLSVWTVFSASESKGGESDSSEQIPGEIGGHGRREMALQVVATAAYDWQDETLLGALRNVGIYELGQDRATFAAKRALLIELVRSQERGPHLVRLVSDQQKIVRLMSIDKIFCTEVLAVFFRLRVLPQSDVAQHEIATWMQNNLFTSSMPVERRISFISAFLIPQYYLLLNQERERARRGGAPIGGDRFRQRAITRFLHIPAIAQVEGFYNFWERLWQQLIIAASCHDMCAGVLVNFIRDAGSNIEVAVFIANAINVQWVQSLVRKMWGGSKMAYVLLTALSKVFKRAQGRPGVHNHF